MKWADFETERAALRKNLDEIKLFAANATYPQGSSRDQVGRIASKRTFVKNMQRELDAEISGNMEKPTDLDHVSMTWDMPAVPAVSKTFLKIHNEGSSKIEGLRDAFSQDFHVRKDLVFKDISIFDF